MMARPLRIAGLVLVASGLLACGGSDDEPPADGGSATPLANAIAVDAAVDVALDDAEFEPVDAPVPVSVGDVVRTDANGFAEVAYFDGSLTRLDVNSELTIVELVRRGDVSSIRAEMGVGRTWSRVEELAESDDEFVVETPVASAAVRGTTFFIDCPNTSSCRFTVLQGAIELRTSSGATRRIEAPSSVEVGSAGIGDVEQVDAEELVAGDEWLVRNTERDEDAGAGGAGDSDGGNGSSVDLSQLDVCELLDDADVQRLTGVDGPFASQGRSGSCFWGSTRPGVGAYVEVSAFRSPGLPGTRSGGQGCSFEPTDAVGEEAEIETCPAGAGTAQAKVRLQAFARGVLVTVLVNDPAGPVPEPALAAAASAVFSRIG